jgi:hypothetical protein
VVKKEKVTEESSEEWVARKEPEKLPVEVPVVEVEKECKHCCERLCVCIVSKDVTPSGWRGAEGSSTRTPNMG